MARRGDNIYKRKDGRWEGRFVKERIDGKVKLGCVFGRTYRECKEKLIVAKYENTVNQASIIAQRGTIKAISADWLKDSTIFVKPATTARYEDYLRCYILPEFGDRHIDSLVNQDISNFCNVLLTNGGAKGQGLSPKTVSEILRVLKHLRKYAINHGYMVGFTSDCAFIRQKREEMRVFNQTERKKLQSYLSSNQNLCNIGIQLCLRTGIRIGELCALKWDDFSIDNQELHIHATLQRVRNEDSEGTAKTKVIISSPKSDSSVRTIPLPQDMCPNLANVCKPGTFFLTGDNEKFIEPRTMQNRFKAVLDECGIEDANFHALRHTFATVCIEAGFDVKCLSEILGHANINITLDRYVHSTMAMKQRNMAKLPPM